MEKREDFYIPEEVAEWVSLKKSEYLSKLIQIQGAGDIGFEEFHLYDRLIGGTIESPDKAFESSEDQEIIRTYVKSYSERFNYHQVVVGVVLDDKERKANVFIPIITFVTKNVDVVKEFCVGEVITRPTLN
jgi:hypothetical protein